MLAFVSLGWAVGRVEEECRLERMQWSKHLWFGLINVRNVARTAFITCCWKLLEKGEL